MTPHDPASPTPHDPSPRSSPMPRTLPMPRTPGTLPLPPLPRIGAAAVRRRNAALTLLHGARLEMADRVLDLQCVDRPAPASPALRVRFSVGTQRLCADFETLPFAEHAAQMIAPWQPEDLTPELRATLLEVLLDSATGQLPQMQPAFEDMRSGGDSGDGAQPPGLRLALRAAAAGGAPFFVHLYLDGDADPEAWTAALRLDRGAPLFPPALHLQLPLVAGTALLDLDDLLDLAPGDVIFLDPPPPGSAAAHAGPRHAMETRPSGCSVISGVTSW